MHNARVHRHRSRNASQGLKRLEVTVPTEDAALVRALATQLRRGGEVAQHMRAQLQPLLNHGSSGAELVEFFRNSPLVGSGVEFERDPSTGREIEF
jgi:hypothetical protein